MMIMRIVRTNTNATNTNTNTNTTNTTTNREIQMDNASGSFWSKELLSIYYATSDLLTQPGSFGLRRRRVKMERKKCGQK